MRKDVKNNPSVKLGYKFLTSFIEVASPYLNQKELAFYERIVEDIDFNRHPESVSNYLILVTDSVLKTALKNML